MDDNFDLQFKLKAFEEVEDIIQHPDKYPSYTDIDKMIEDLLA